MEKMKKNPYAFICDVETTGFSPVKNDIIQLAGIVVDLESHETKSEFNEFCRPITPDSWGEGAERVHKISKQRAYGFQHPRKMGIKFLHFIKPYKTDDNLPLQFIFHAMGKFDWDFFRNTFRKVKLLNSIYKVFDDNHFESTITMANQYRSVTGLNSAKLNVLADHFNIKFNHHEALSDVYATFEIWKIFKKMQHKQLDLNI